MDFHMCSKLLHLSVLSPMIRTCPSFICFVFFQNSNSKVIKPKVEYLKDLKMKVKPKNAKITKHTALVKDQNVPFIITCTSYKLENKPKYTLHKM